MAPSALPAPTSVCSSSINKITRPSSLESSPKTLFKRSSNSPRYLAPAISEPRSRDITFLSFKPSGTSPLTIRCASPSMIAVLPTPGSPIKTGLFLVRRAKTWMVRRISSSRPITGSSLPSRARSVRSTVYLFSASRCSSVLSVITLSSPRVVAMTAINSFRSTPHSLINLLQPL